MPTRINYITTCCHVKDRIVILDDRTTRIIQFARVETRRPYRIGETDVDRAGDGPDSGDRPPLGVCGGSRGRHPVVADRQAHPGAPPGGGADAGGRPAARPVRRRPVSAALAVHSHADLTPQEVSAYY